MAMGAKPELTWANIIGTLVFLVALAGLAGTVVQNQFGSIRDELRDARGLALTRSDSVATELSRREAELKAELKEVHNELLMRRQEFVTQFEFKQFSTSADDRWRTQAEINKQAIDAYLSTKAFDAWKSGREQISTEFSTRLRELERQSRPDKGT